MSLHEDSSLLYRRKLFLSSQYRFYFFNGFFSDNLSCIFYYFNINEQKATLFYKQTEYYYMNDLFSVAHMFRIRTKWKIELIKLF